MQGQLESIRQQLRVEHRREANVGASLELAEDGLLALRAGHFHPLADLATVVAIQDAAFDFDALHLAFHAADAYARSGRMLTETAEPEVADEYRLHAFFLSARSSVRTGPVQRAYAYSIALLTRLEQLAGGREGVIDLLRSPVRSPLGEAAVAFTGIAPTAARLPGLTPKAQETLLVPSASFARALFLENDSRPEYLRMHAAAVQSVFAFAKEGADPELFWAAVETEATSRPSDPRGQATRALVDVAVAEYERRFTEALAAAERAKLDMSAFQLHRALRAIEFRKWWPAAKAA